MLDINDEIFMIIFIMKYYLREKKSFSLLNLQKTIQKTVIFHNFTFKKLFDSPSHLILHFFLFFTKLNNFTIVFLF